MTLTVGRHTHAGLRIDDPLVSRNHLRVVEQGDGWIAEDLGSANGTFCDGQRIERLELGSETLLRLGDPAGPWLRIRAALPAQIGSEPVRPAGITTYSLASGTIRFGRSSGSDIVVDDLLVSRHHAEVRRSADGRLELVDMDSHNGTFLNGRRVQKAVLSDLDLIGVGGRQFRLSGDQLVDHHDLGDVAFAALGITVEASDKTLVHDVGFALERGSLLGVVGPSGSGKTTLLSALSGLRPPAGGTVYFAGRDLYAHYDELRQRIGFVPQDDIVHPELTVEQSLKYAAELRFPPDVSAEERQARIQAVMVELGLYERRALPVNKLSGGQRKRVSVALELLTTPTLLFLDEPTSGLDPGLERSLMELLRDLADAGRTVIVVTHSIDSLNLCDRVLCLAPGGYTAYFGPPQLTTAYFGRDDYQQVFADLSEGDPAQWAARFLASDYGERYLAEPLRGFQPGATAARYTFPRPGRSWFRQFSMLTRRYGRVFASDRLSIALLLISSPLMSLLMLWRLPVGEFEVLDSGEVKLISQASLVLFVVALGMTQVGVVLAIREIAKEQPIFRRERAVGLSISAYLLSKVVVLGAIVAAQAAVIVPIASARQRGPADAVLLGWPLGELIVVGAVIGLAAMALGLLVSSMVGSVNTAMAMLPMILVFQVLLGSGGVVPSGNERPVLRELSYASSAQWGFAAAASTVQLNRLQVFTNLTRDLPTIDPENLEDLSTFEFEQENTGQPFWNHRADAWLTDMIALAVITVGCLVLAGLALRRFDPV